MAEISRESILESIKRLLKQNDILSKTFEETLNKVLEIEQHLKAIIQYCDTEQQSGENQGLEALKSMCEAVVYGDYIREKTNAAALAHVVSKMEIEKFPQSVRPKGYEIKGYIEEIAAQLEEIDNLVKEFDKMIKEFSKNQYRISETERIDLEMKKLEFEGGLEICTDYQTQAAETMKELNSEIDAYKARQRNASIAKTVCVGVIGAGGANTKKTMEGSFESILESTKELLKKNEILSKILEEKLNKVCEIEQHLEVINQICDMESDENQGVGAVRDTCKALAYGGYLKEKTDAAGLEHVVKKMEIEKFPESIQPKGYEIKGYVEQIAVQLEKVDNLINEIGEMLFSWGLRALLPVYAWR